MRLKQINSKYVFSMLFEQITFSKRISFFIYVYVSITSNTQNNHDIKSGLCCIELKNKSTYILHLSYFLSKLITKLWFVETSYKKYLFSLHFYTTIDIVHVDYKVNKKPKYNKRKKDSLHIYNNFVLFEYNKCLLSMCIVYNASNRLTFGSY